MGPAARRRPEPLDSPRNRRTTLWRVLLSPAYALAIALEARLARWLPLRIPRDIEELVRRPDRLTRHLCTPGGPLPADARVISVERFGHLPNEPLKDAISGALRVRARDAEGEDHEALVFAKFQTSRTLPLHMQALRAAVERGIAREVDFYRHLAPDFPIRVARPWYVDAIPAVNRVVLVLERIEGWTPSDAVGCPLEGVRAILDRIARVNARYIDPDPDDPRTSWIPAQVGLDAHEFVGDQLRGASENTRALWRRLRRAFDDRPVTLVHGDCRPGNMIFTGPDWERLRDHPPAGGEFGVSAWPEGPLPEVVLSDWEATNIGPLLTDFVYVVSAGLRVGDRRVWRDRLLLEFLDVLRENGVPAAWCDPDRARTEVELLSLVLVFHMHVIMKARWWAQRENAQQDFDVWAVRFLTLSWELDHAAIADALDVPVESVTRFIEEITPADADAMAGPGPWSTRAA